jgi:hypothetical protein
MNEPGLRPHKETRTLTGAMDKELPCLTRIVEHLSPRPIRAQKPLSLTSHSRTCKGAEWAQTTIDAQTLHPSTSILLSMTVNSTRDPKMKCRLFVRTHGISQSCQWDGAAISTPLIFVPEEQLYCRFTSNISNDFFLSRYLTTNLHSCRGIRGSSLLV